MIRDWLRSIIHPDKPTPEESLELTRMRALAEINRLSARSFQLDELYKANEEIIEQRGKWTKDSIWVSREDFFRLKRNLMEIEMLANDSFNVESRPVDAPLHYITATGPKEIKYDKYGESDD